MKLKRIRTELKRTVSKPKSTETELESDVTMRRGRLEIEFLVCLSRDTGRR